MGSNVELVRDAFAAVHAGDVDAFIATLQEDVEFVSITGRLTGRGPYVGHEGIREWDRDRRATWGLEAEPRRPHSPHRGLYKRGGGERRLRGRLTLMLTQGAVDLAALVLVA